MRFLLSAVLAGGVIGTAGAANYDSRLYVSPGVSYVAADAGRGVNNGEAFSVTVGMPVADNRNYELDLGWAELDSTKLINLNANMISFFDPKLPMLFSVLSAGVLSVDSALGDNYFSPNVAAGLGAMIPAWMGKLRIEGLLRADLHFNGAAGLGGKRAFIEPIVRLGYSIPLGAQRTLQANDSTAVDVIRPAGQDNDGDGVNDNTDLCPGTPLGTVVDATGCAVQGAGAIAPSKQDCRSPALDEAVDQFGCAVDRAVILNGVNFDFDSDLLTDQAKKVLDDVATVLQGMAGAKAEIAGHTSDEGNEHYNIDLSQRRADAVRSYLLAAGVPAKQLVAKGYGGNAPLAANDSIRNRKQNRRVEVKIIK